MPFVAQVIARLGLLSPAAHPHSLNRGPNHIETEYPGVACTYDSDTAITATKKNIFNSLTDREYADVTAFLHEQKALNLTAVVNSTSYVPF